MPEFCTSQVAPPSSVCRIKPPPPTTQASYLKVYKQYAPLFAQLTPDASEKVRKMNYERLFDEARVKVRAWEKAHVKETHQ